MKIAITGAHRVGKTALAEKLLESLPGYEYNQEPYYELEEAGYEFSETPTADDYLAQLEYSIKQLSTGEQNILFDRCPVDLLAYIQAIGQSEDIQSLYHKVQNAMKEIDLLIFVPVEQPDRIICSRSDLPELRYQVNEILNDWIMDLDVETIEVHGTPADRRNQVIGEVLKL